MNKNDDSMLSAQALQEKNVQLTAQNAQLQQQLLLYKPLFQQTRDAVFIISLDTFSYLAVNDIATQLLGYQKEELIGKAVSELIMPDQFSQSNEIKKRLLLGEPIPRYERTFQHKSGKPIVIELEVSLVFDKEGIPHHIQSIGRDITRQHHVEESLYQSTAHWQDLKVLQEVSTAISSSLELDQVLNIIATQTTHLLNVDTCAIMLLEPPDDLVLIASIGLSVELAEVGRQKADEGLSGWVASQRQTIQVEDVQNHEKSLYPELMKGRRFRTYLGAPMLVGDVLIGVIEIFAKTARRFTNDEIRMLEAVTSQAAVAVEKAKLFSELKERINEVEWQYRAVQALSNELDTAQVLQKLAEYLAKALNATSVFISELGQGQTIILVNEYWADTAVSAERISEIGIVFRMQDYPHYVEALQTGTMQTLSFDNEALSLNERKLFEIQQAKSILLIPIIRAGITYGLAEIWDSRQKRIFHLREKRLAETIAQHAASVIENVHLFQQVSNQADKLETEVTQRTSELLDSNNQLRQEIVTRQRVENELNNKTETLVVINKIADATYHVFDINRVYQRVVETLVEYPRFAGAVVFLLDKKQEFLSATAFAGIDKESLASFAQIPVQNSLAGVAVQSGEITHSRNFLKDNRSSLHLRKLAEELFVGLVSVPIMHNQVVIGVLNVFLPHEDGITNLEEEMLSSVSKTIGLAIVNAQYVSQIETEIEERLQVESALQIYMNELKRSNLELQEFAYIASHDLQEPLRKIQAFGDRLSRQYENELDGRGLDYLSRMQNAAGRMRLLIDNLLLFSRVTTAAQPFAVVDLNRVITAVLSDLQSRIQEKDAVLKIATLPIIEAEPFQMYQLLQNLIGNALKFVEPDVQPHIEIVCHCISERDMVTGMLDHKQVCQLVVRDNGIGIDMQYQERIFNLFERLHGRKLYEGTGIGLAICKKIVDRHNGRIAVKSELGNGTTFIITLPMTQKQ